MGVGHKSWWFAVVIFFVAALSTSAAKHTKDTLAAVKKTLLPRKHCWLTCAKKRSGTKGTSKHLSSYH